METDSIDMLITLLDSMIVRDTSWSAIQALIAGRYEEAPMRPGIGWTSVHSGSQAIQIHYKSTSKETFQYTPLIMESHIDNISSDFPPIIQDAPFYLFPNPAKNEIQIPKEWILSMERSTLQAMILDLSGRVVHQITLQNLGESMTLNVSNLIDGIYILYLSGSSGLSYNGKFIIKR